MTAGVSVAGGLSEELVIVYQINTVNSSVKRHLIFSVKCSLAWRLKGATAAPMSSAKAKQFPGSQRVLNRAANSPRLLIIGGIDTRAASGVLADLRACADLPIWAEVVPSALTVQAAQKPRISATALGDFVAALELAQAQTQPISAIKVGMLCTPEQAKAVVATLPAHVPLVFDPVLETTVGLRLYKGSPRSLKDLVARATLLTPNMDEAEALASLPCQAVLIKGGHQSGRMVRDVLVSKTGERAFEKKRVRYQVRGTGCALATRIAAELALGRTVEHAVERAEKWMERAYLRAAAFSLAACSITNLLAAANF